MFCTEKGYRATSRIESRTRFAGGQSSCARRYAAKSKTKVRVLGTAGAETVLPGRCANSVRLRSGQRMRCGVVLRWRMVVVGERGGGGGNGEVGAAQKPRLVNCTAKSKSSGRGSGTDCTGIAVVCV
eukprot:532231-Rhodomonas_salina.1